MQRTPFITNVTDNIANRQKDTILSAYAVGKLFTGITKTALNLNTYVEPGVIRIDTGATFGPDNVDPKGFLHITSINKDEDTSPDKNKYIIRQVLYPDNNEFNTQTRIGTGTTVGNIVWSDWTEMGGGGFLKRIKLDHNMTGINGDIAIPNAMYYSYGNFTLVLPNPANYRLGTRIGLEQMSNPKVGGIVGTGLIKYGAKEQSTAADYKVEINEETGELTTTDELVGSIMYVMTVTDVNDTPEWVLEVSNSVLEMVSFVNNRVTAHIADAGDPHWAAGYLKDTRLTSQVDATTVDKAVTPKGVYDAIVGADSSAGFVVKTELYVDPTSANPIVNNIRLPNATDIARGIIQIATDTDVKTGTDTTRAVTPAHIGARRLVHKGSFKSDTVITITEDDLKISNPLIAVVGGTRTVNLPTATLDLVSRTATVYIDLIRNTAETKVTVISGSLSETFINTEDSTTIQLVFEASYGITSGTYTWKLVL